MKLDAISLLYDYKKQYNYAMSCIDVLEQLTQDLLHKLELDRLSYNEKAKLAVKLSKVRKDRRHYKNMIEIYGPLVDLENKQGLTVARVADTLAKSRAAYEKLSKRTYSPRITIDTQTKKVQF